MSSPVSWFYGPQITVLAAPHFTMPADWPIQWPATNAATDAEALAEYAGRLCYLSQHNPAQRTTAEYHQHILEQAHGSILEHANISLLIQGVSRSLTHELIRHRAGTAVSQLSQRFVDESDAAFVVPPLLIDRPVLLQNWKAQCEAALVSYRELVEQLLTDPDIQQLPATLRRKRARECARAVLPNCTETKLVWTANLRALRHVITLRGDVHADAEILRFARVLLETVRPLAPAIFADFTTDEHGSLVPQFRKV